MDETGVFLRFSVCEVAHYAVDLLLETVVEGVTEHDNVSKVLVFASGVIEEFFAGATKWQVITWRKRLPHNCGRNLRTKMSNFIADVILVIIALVFITDFGQLLLAQSDELCPFDVIFEISLQAPCVTVAPEALPKRIRR